MQSFMGNGMDDKHKIYEKKKRDIVTVSHSIAILLSFTLSLNSVKNLSKEYVHIV